MKGVISLNKNQDFRRVYSKGKYVSSGLLVSYVLKNKLRSVRLGITTSKKIGNAVKRNRARRVLRACFSKIRPCLPAGLDIVFVARKNTSLAKCGEVFKDMSYQMSKLGVLK